MKYAEVTIAVPLPDELVIGAARGRPLPPEEWDWNHLLGEENTVVVTQVREVAPDTVITDYHGNNVVRAT